MRGDVEKRIKLSVEVTPEEYTKMILLIIADEYPNMKSIVREGLKRIFKDYGEEYFEELREKHKDVIENILSKVKIIERRKLRRWIVKK